MKKSAILAVIIFILIFGTIVGLLIRKGLNSSQNKVSVVPKTQNIMTSNNSTFSHSDVVEHASASDCWMVIEGIVYDVTSYISDHPGGNDILQGCGTDATAIFTNRPEDGNSHSGLARATLANYKIGILAQ